LATIAVLGPVSRFHDSKHVVSYVGLAPALNASADKYRLGHITKQGSTLLRFVLGQARKLLVRLFISSEIRLTTTNSGLAAALAPSPARRRSRP
jgi:transposase